MHPAEPGGITPMGKGNPGGRFYAAAFVDHNPFPDQAPGLEGLEQKVSALA
jgi:hypothetical protein